MFVELTARFLKWLVPAVWRIDDETKSIYLTFDDGPCPDVTPKVLDILDKYGIKATFFCVGDNVRKYPETFRLVVDKGHRTGNHTMHHLKGFCTPVAEYIDDVEEADKYIGSNLFRPPYGRITMKQLRFLRQRYKIVMWDVITRDYNRKLTPEKCFSIVKRFARSGSIIIFHDSKKSADNVLSALPLSIEWLIRQGYTFKTIG